jgi:phosphatidylglycerol---prolipoprotein diacylglyceryl transferase
MYPVLFQIGDFKVQSFGVMLIIAFFVAVYIARRRAERFGYTPDEVSDAGFWSLIIGVLGARVMFILLSLDEYLGHPDKLLSLRFEGLTSFGGLLFGFIFLLFWSKRKKRSTLALFDLLAAPVLIAHAIGRVGCLLNGCCHGPKCAPGEQFCVAIGPNNLNVYQPAQIYDSLMCVAAYLLLVHLERRGLMRGQGMSLFLVLYGASRFIYEFWRAGVSSEVLGPIPLTLAQVTAIAMVVVGAGLFVWYGRRKPSDEPKAAPA